MEMNKSDTVAVIRSLLTSTNSSCNVYDLNRDFKNETGVDIPLFGYANIGDFLHSIPDTVKALQPVTLATNLVKKNRVTGLYPAQQVSLVTNEKSAHIVSLVKRQKNSGQKGRAFARCGPISRKFSVAPRPNGFQKDHILLGKTTLEKPFSKKSVDNSKLEESRGPDDTSKLEGSKEADNNSKDSATSFGAHFLPKKGDSPSSNATNGIVSLESCLGIGESIPHIHMEHHAQVGGYVEVYPCKIFNPHKFYFHFRKFKKKLSEFMDALQVFYITHSVPRVAGEVMRPKLMCAAFHKTYEGTMWYRAEIQEVVDNSRLIVNFIDYGDLVEIPKENVKYLHRDFASLPRQAILGSLANIGPSKGGSDWSPDATRRFFSLSFRKDLVAGVVHMDPKDFFMNVALSCTRGLEIHINDTLVKEGYAEFDTDVLGYQFSDILESGFGNSRDTEEENRNKMELSNDRANHDEEFTKDVLKPGGDCVCPNFPSPIFYFSNNRDYNERLKKMFSAKKSCTLKGCEDL